MFTVSSVLWLSVGILGLLKLLSLAVQNAISSSNAGNTGMTVAWSFLAGTPLIILFTLWMQEVFQAVFLQNFYGIQTLIVLSVSSLSMLSYLAFTVYNAVTSANAGNVNSALNWAFAAAVPLVIVLTLWILQML